MEAAAAYLLEHETMSGEDFAGVMGFPKDGAHAGQAVVHDGVARLVVGRELPLVLRHHAATLLRTGDDLDDRLLEVVHSDELLSLPPSVDPVHEVTIIPRGQAGGMTISLPGEDRGYYSKRYMEEEIAALLGGRVAESLFLDDGAQTLAHAVGRDHLPGDLGGPLDVVGRAGGDIVQEQALRHPQPPGGGDQGHRRSGEAQPRGAGA